MRRSVPVLTACALLGIAIGVAQKYANRDRISLSSLSLEKPVPLMKPLVSAIAEIDSSDFEEMRTRMAALRGEGLGFMLHALHLEGDVAVPERDHDMPCSIVDLLLDSDRGAAYFDGFRTLVTTRYGARFTVRRDQLTGIDQRGTEAHPGQSLSVLGILGVPASQPIRVPGRRAATVRTIVEDLLANFVLEGEIFWDAVAIAAYVPPERSWRNKFGQVFTFDHLALELLKRPVDGSSCAGTHRIIALLALIQTDAARPILAPEVRQRVRVHLGRVAAILVNTQAADGSWTGDWYNVMKEHPHEHSAAHGEVIDKIIATGHHLEWLMALPDDLRPERQVFVHGAGYLARVLPELSRDEAWLTEWYCPATHAIRSLAYLRSDGEVMLPKANASYKAPSSRNGG